MTKLTDTMLEMMYEFGATADRIDTETDTVYCLRYTVGDEKWVSLLTEQQDGSVHHLCFQGENLTKLKALLEQAGG